MATEMGDTVRMAQRSLVIGQNLKRIRQARGLSQSELADRSRIFQQQTILKIEKGTRPLRLDEASLLADILGVDVNDFMAVDDDPVMTEYLQATARHDRAKERVRELREQMLSLEGQLAVAESDERHQRMLWQEALKKRQEQGWDA